MKTNNFENQIPRFIVMTATASMPSTLKFGTYRKVAVVETNQKDLPKQIHPNHKSVVNIVHIWDRLNVGTTDRCAYQIALKEAQTLANELNGS